MVGKLQSETHFRGLPISGGVVLARICLFRQDRHEDAQDYRASGEGIETERVRLTRAVAEVVRHLESLRHVVAERIGDAEAEIFNVQRMILQDPTLERELAEAVDAGHGAEMAVLRTVGAYEARLQEVESDYHKERATDIGEVKRRLLDVLRDTGPAFLCVSEPHCQRGRQRIVITEELTPALALELDTDEILGIITDRGGMTSHAAILVRALGIPAVSGIPHIHDLVTCGTEVLLSGDTGEVVVWPQPETVAALDVAPHRPAREPAVDPVDGLSVMANISLAFEARQARAMKAEGIGLYRTELEFFAAGHLLSEEEQVDRYAAVLQAMGRRPVYFRLLDIGGDKPSPVFEFPDEENPALGLRGVRYLLSRPDLLRAQARALARVSVRRPIHIMYPMVTDRAQFRRARQIFDEATADLPKGEIHHGVMFEVPSAVLEAPEIFEDAAFGSIGSNDLVQYLFAVDRNNDLVAADYSPDRPVFWRLIESLVRDAEAAGRPLSICGEMAADPKYIPRLMAMGIRSISVSSRLIPEVRRAAKESPSRGESHEKRAHRPRHTER